MVFFLTGMHQIPEMFNQSVTQSLLEFLPVLAGLLLPAMWVMRVL